MPFSAKTTQVMLLSFVLLIDSKGIIFYETCIRAATAAERSRMLGALFQEKRFLRRLHDALDVCILRNQMREPGGGGHERRELFAFYRRCKQHGLTRSEIMVVYQKGLGLPDEEVAAALHKSSHTINSQLKSIYDKLRVKSILQALNLLKPPGSGR